MVCLFAAGGLEMGLNRQLAWTFSGFKGTVAHEIGHLLGLGDVKNPSLLMNESYKGVNKPQQGDIDEAVRKRWPMV